MDVVAFLAERQLDGFEGFGRSYLRAAGYVYRGAGLDSLVDEVARHFEDGVVGFQSWCGGVVEEK